jgi:electron transfer flavoprotein alpha subunit
MRAEIGVIRAFIFMEVKALEGLIGMENQVGQTGTTVRPKVYFAIGISGAFQHRVGMQNSSKIVAINTDTWALIFRIAHYPKVGDLHEELPRLVSAVGEGEHAN